MADFFDKVVVGINKGINAVNENSKTLLDRAKLNVQEAELEEKKAKALQQLGNLVYGMQCEDVLSETTFQNLCKEIEVYDQEIVRLRSEKQNLEGYKKSSVGISKLTIESGGTCKCGYINKKGAKFCAVCGMKFK